jgi:hypothetical protein
MRLLPPVAGALALTILLAVAAAGPAEVITPDGGRYAGPLVDGLRHGKGRVTWANGASYEGEFQRGVYSGQGREVQVGGEVYEGQFADGQPNGPGHYKDDRTEYRGGFRNGRFEGEGELRTDDGRTYKGGFRNGRFEGRGRYATKAGEVWEGDFANDDFLRGVATRPDGTRHEGGFENWLPKGKGTFTDEAGGVFEGDFGPEGLSGPGRFVGKDGTRYDGQFKFWRYEGKGRLRLPNGDVYEGHFANGMYDGEGTLTYGKPQTDGKRAESGRWRFGQRVDKDAEAAAARNVELALYNQRGLLDAAIGNLQPRREGVINLFLLGVAGDGTQEVFRREVEYVREAFDRRFGTQGRSLLLMNSRNTVGTAPMATLTSVGEAIDAIARRMDRDKDILFLYLSSHGSEKHELTLAQQRIDLPDLAAGRLAEMLDRSGIKWRVVVVSACYSGGFIAPLKNANTIVITAARHDRQSFGCADENDFTYFGRAFFKESLPASESFTEAFAKAEKLIVEWEKRDFKAGEPNGEEAFSEPQIHAGRAIEKHLARWWTQAAGLNRQASRQTPAMH